VGNQNTKKVNRKEGRSPHPDNEKHKGEVIHGRRKIGKPHNSLVNLKGVGNGHDRGEGLQGNGLGAMKPKEIMRIGEARDPPKTRWVNHRRRHLGHEKKKEKTLREKLTQKACANRTKPKCSA